MSPKEHIEPDDYDKDEIIKVAFVYNQLASFIKQDYDILSQYYNVEVADYTNLLDILKIAKAILASDVSFSWFAAGHSTIAVLLSRMLGKRSVVIAGGYEVAKVPELSYGQFTGPWHRKAMTRFSLKYADVIVAVSNFTKKEVLEREKPRNLKTIYNGVEVGKFKQPSKSTDKEPLVLTVGGINRSNIKRKGLETFVKAAPLVPEAQFAVVGKEIDESAGYLRSIASKNVEFTGRVTDEELADWYRRAKVYVQASAYESFGLSLAEAMLCECVPVVTEKGALPEVVGDTGYFVPYGDEVATAMMIREALRSDKGQKARERVERIFPLEKRARELVEAISEVKPSHSA